MAFPAGWTPTSPSRERWRWPTARWSSTRCSRDAHLARSDALLISLAPHDAGAADAARGAPSSRPGSVAVYLSVAHALEHMGRWDAALQQAQRALALDPLSTGVRHSAIAIALGARQYDLALEEARRARAFDPKRPDRRDASGQRAAAEGRRRRRAPTLPLKPWLAHQGDLPPRGRPHSRGAGAGRLAGAACSTEASTRSCRSSRRWPATGPGWATPPGRLMLAPEGGRRLSDGPLLAPRIGALRPGAPRHGVRRRDRAAGGRDPRPRRRRSRASWGTGWNEPSHRAEVKWDVASPELLRS